jgi:glycosyltransferase involved in cell wall biosynthesis
MKNNIIVDCKNLAQYSSGIAGYFKPLLKSTIEHFEQYHFILVAPSEFDTAFIKEYSNWEVKIISQKKFENATLDILAYDMWTYPNSIKKLDACLLISPYYDFIIPSKFKNKSIITGHDLCYWELDQSYSQKVKLYHKLLLNLNISKAKKIITVSKTSLDMIKKIFGNDIYDKSVVVYNTFEVEGIGALTLKKNGRKKSLLYTGGFEQRKNVDMLFRVISELKKELEIELVFTGNFKDNIQLKQLIKEYQLEDIVNLTGIVSHEELQNFYMQCDTVVNISLCEGFGRSNLEAMIYNKPLVCSDIEVFRELVGEYALYCDPTSIKSIKDAVKKSFELNEKIKIKLDIERFKFETNKNKFIETIQEVLDGK